MPAPSIFDRLSVTVGGVRFETWQVLAIIILLFLLVFVMASVRRHFLEWTVKGAGFGIVLGFVLALVIEGLLMVGGKTMLTEVLGWKNAPKPIQKTIDNARAEFIEVLGAQTELQAKDITVDEVIKAYQSLAPADAARANFQICE